MLNNEDFDIMGNIKLIENYKTFMLSAVADLFMTMSKESKSNMDEISDELSEIIILSYLLGKKLGINFSSLDEKIIKKLKVGAAKDDKINREYQDYAKLISYIRDRKEI